MDIRDGIDCVSSSPNAESVNVTEQSENEAIIVFEMSGLDDTDRYEDIPNSAVYLTTVNGQAKIAEYDIRFGSGWNVDQLKSSEFAEILRGRIHNGGQQDENILHVTAYNTMINPRTFIQKFDAAVNYLRRIDE